MRQGGRFRMKNQEKDSAKSSPLASLGGFVATMRPEDAVRVDLAGENILLAVYRVPGSRSNCRLRIIAAKHIGIKRLTQEDINFLLQLREGAST